MEKTAFLFPGQGAQYVGMGKDIYENFDEAKKIYNKASEILNIDIPKLCFESTEEELSLTNNTQIAILVTSLASLEVVKQYKKPDICAGLSLGEYTALIYAGYISFEDGIKIVRKRGELMQNLKPIGNFSMLALIGGEEKSINEMCNKINQNTGFISPANYNYTGQIVLSGEESSIDEAMQMFKEYGIKKAIKLKTNGPFHTLKLEKASIEFRKELEKIEIKNGDIEVLKNLDGNKYTNSDDIKEILSKHIINPVRFDKTIQNMLDSNVKNFYEIGPGKVLTGFVKKTNQEVKLVNINNVQDLEDLKNG